MCDMIIVCVSCRTFSAFAAMILLIAYDCIMQLLPHLCLKAVMYFSLRLDSEEHNKSGFITLELLISCSAKPIS